MINKERTKLFQRHLGIERRVMPMRVKDVKGWKARKTVSGRLRLFFAMLMQRFKTPPEELLKRAEERAAQPKSPDTEREEARNS